MLHKSDHVARAHRTLEGFLESLIVAGAASGAVRDDIPARELAAYCLHALTAVSFVDSEAAARRLVTVVLAGLAAQTLPDH